MLLPLMMNIISVYRYFSIFKIFINNHLISAQRIENHNVIIKFRDVIKLNSSEIILYCVAGCCASTEYNWLFQYKKDNSNNYANKYLLELVLPDHIHQTSPMYHIYQHRRSIKHNLISENFSHRQQS